MQQVDVEILALAITAQYGTLQPGDILRTNVAFARHLVEDCGAAKYTTAPLPASALASGGEYAGGVRLVGHVGPELEITGLSGFVNLPVPVELQTSARVENGTDTPPANPAAQAKRKPKGTKVSSDIASVQPAEKETVNTAPEGGGTAVQTGVQTSAQDQDGGSSPPPMPGTEDKPVDAPGDTRTA